jgi:hypothetical protein
MAKH